MSNLRIVYRNEVDKGTVVASSEVGTLLASNLLTERKSDVWRSSSGTATLTITFPTAQFIGCVITPFCSLTSAATMRVRTYTETTDPSPIEDSGVQYACAATPLGLWEWGAIPLGVNSYSYGGANYGRVWFDTHAVKKVVIDIDDSTNPLGYVEMARLVMGSYFSPENDAELDATVEVVETSKNERNDATDLITDLGGKSKKITFNLAHMTTADRNAISNIFKGNGVARPLFISLYPDSSDPSEEQLYQLYGKLSNQSSIAMAYWSAYSTTITVEES